MCPDIEFTDIGCPDIEAWCMHDSISGHKIVWILRHPYIEASGYHIMLFDASIYRIPVFVVPQYIYCNCRHDNI